jgi:uncharacterized protein
MKKIILLLLLLLSLFPCLGRALDVPALHARVNDYAGILSPEAVRKIEAKLAAFEKSDSTQIVVLTIPSLAGENLEEYSMKVAEAWKIGQKGKGNGAILLVAKQERKLRIEVGSGLEGKLTDLVSGRIIRNDIAPYFKSGNFDDGIVSGVSALISVVKGEYHAPSRELPPGKRNAPPLFTLALFFLVACIFMGAVSRVLAGLVGAAGLPLIAFFLFPGLALLSLAGIGALGFIAGLVIALLFGNGGGGGFFWGGFFGGGFGGGSSGEDGGGFFGGGGDFGGGGASGEW